MKRLKMTETVVSPVRMNEDITLSRYIADPDSVPVGSSKAIIVTDTLTGDYEADLRHPSMYFILDGSGVAAIAISVVGGEAGGVYTFRFPGIATLDITWPSNFYDETDTAFGTTSHTDSVMYTFICDGTDFYAKSA